MLRVELDNTTNVNDFCHPSWSEGYLWSWRVDGAGELMAHNRTTLLDEADTCAFGQKWRVTPSDPKLLHTMEGPQHPEQCQMSTLAADLPIGLLPH